MRGINRLGIFVSVMLLLVSLGGCSEDMVNPLRVGTNPWPGYEPLFLAKTEGLYSTPDIQFIEYPSPSGSVRAMQNGSIEAAALTLDEVLKLLESKLPIKIVLIMDISDGGDAILAQANIGSVKQLQDKHVSTEPSVLSRYILMRALELNDLSLEDLKISNASVTEQLELFTNKEIDAVVSYEPTRSQLLSHGAREIFSSKDIPGEIVDVLVVREDALSGHREHIQALVDGWYRALAYLNEQPQRSAEVLSQRLRIPAAEVASSFDGMQMPMRQHTAAMLSGGEGNMKETARRLMAVMQKQGLLSQAVKIDDLFNAEFVSPGAL